jgi:hypothetical protein
MSDILADFLVMHFLSKGILAQTLADVAVDQLFHDEVLVESGGKD